MASAQDHGRERVRLFWLLLVVALCSLHKLRNQPVWDDAYLLEQVGKLQAQGQPLRVLGQSTLAFVLELDQASLDQNLDLYRPLALLSLYAGHVLGGGSPIAQHLINTLLHLACVALVYALGRRLLDDARLALIAAAWFGLTPVLVEAHVWISGRFDLLSTSCGLLAIWLWARAGDPERSARARRAQLWAALLAFLLGLLAKEPLLFALPALVLWPQRERAEALDARLVALAPLWWASGIYIGLRAWALHGGVGVPGSRLQGLLQAPLLLLDGALNALVPIAVYPRTLHEDYAAVAPFAQIAAAVIVLALAVWLARKRAQWPLTVWSALWFATTLAPVALTTAGYWSGFGRHLYLPLSLAVIGAVDAGARIGRALAPHVRSPRLLERALYGYLVLLFLRSHLVTYDWVDEASLFAATAAASPDRSLGHGGLGVALINQRRYAEAVPELARAHELAPDFQHWTTRLGTALLFSGQKQAVLALTQKELALRPRSPAVHLLAAYATLDSDPARSVHHVLECMVIDSKHAQCLEALAFMQSKHPDAARYRKALADALTKPRYQALMQ